MLILLVANPVSSTAPDGMHLVIVLLSAFALGTWLIARSHYRRFMRRWDSIDKRLSEVLWRTRSSDSEAFRQRVVQMEEHLDQINRTFNNLSSTLDAQIETMRSEARASTGRMESLDNRYATQLRMIVFQLERIRKQLGIDRAPSDRPTSDKTTYLTQDRSIVSGGADSGYRLEAVLHPMTRRMNESNDPTTASGATAASESSAEACQKMQQEIEEVKKLFEEI